MTFPDGDWDTVQAPAINGWERQHEQDAHGGEEVSAWQLDPNPMYDRALPGQAWLLSGTVTCRAVPLFALPAVLGVPQESRA